MALTLGRSSFPANDQRLLIRTLVTTFLVSRSVNEDGSTVSDAVVVLKAPKLEGEQLTFNVQVLEGDLAGADGPASLFIDTPDYEISALQSMFPSTNWPPGMRQPPSMQH
jgi:hypothetical protein